MSFFGGSGVVAVFVVVRVKLMNFIHEKYTLFWLFDVLMPVCDCRRKRSARIRPRTEEKKKNVCKQYVSVRRRVREAKPNRTIGQLLMIIMLFGFDFDRFPVGFSLALSIDAETF